MSNTQNSGDSDGKSRRWLIRILVGLGIGIPVVVEGATFLKLFSSTLFGEEDGDGDGTPGSAPDRDGRSVGVGEELLTATEPPETVREMFLRVDGRRFEMTVEVHNTADRPYSLELGVVTTTAGTEADGGVRTGRLSPGSSRVVTGAWDLPSGKRPASVTVTGRLHGETVETIRRQVRLGRVPLRG